MLYIICLVAGYLIAHIPPARIATLEAWIKSKLP